MSKIRFSLVWVAIAASHVVARTQPENVISLPTYVAPEEDKANDGAGDKLQYRPRPNSYSPRPVLQEESSGDEIRKGARYENGREQYIDPSQRSETTDEVIPDPTPEP